MNEVRIIRADLDDPQHQTAVLELTRSYARDPMAGGQDLLLDVQQTLIHRLRAHPTTLVFLAQIEQHSVGIATCFLGFSTFTARPLINIHDLHVLSDCQRRGIGRRLLEAVEAAARELNCCKLTLEVQEGNLAALALYDAYGFAPGEYSSSAGSVLFRQKRL